MRQRNKILAPPQRDIFMTFYAFQVMVLDSRGFFASSLAALHDFKMHNYKKLPFILFSFSQFVRNTTRIIQKVVKRIYGFFFFLIHWKGIYTGWLYMGRRWHIEFSRFCSWPQCSGYHDKWILMDFKWMLFTSKPVFRGEKMTGERLYLRSPPILNTYQDLL